MILQCSREFQFPILWLIVLTLRLTLYSLRTKLMIAVGCVVNTLTDGNEYYDLLYFFLNLLCGSGASI
jgi:hypothetical protein